MTAKRPGTSRLGTFHFDEQRITLPKGTRVVLKTDLRASDGHLCKAGTVGLVVEVVYDSYTLRTPTGRELACQRDQIVIQRQDQLGAVARRQLAWEQLEPHVIYSAVVGSVAWNLADETSDEDEKGVFLLPFDHSAGLWQPTDEIQAPGSDTQYWEVQKVIYQGLRADANTLEMLWSPLRRRSSELGELLIAERRMFVSRNIFGTFGRYAMSQFRKLRAARQRHGIQRAIVALLGETPELEHDALVDRLCGELALFTGKGARRRADEAIRDLYRSLFDRGLLARRGYAPLCRLLGSGEASAVLVEEPRWKNAYNLLRLLCSGIRWLREGEPLIAVEGALRAELLAVKRGEVPLDQILARADALAAELERAYEGTRLPETPDYEAADRYLLACRAHAARTYLRTARVGPVDEGAAEAVAAPARLEVPTGELRWFLEQRHGPGSEHGELDLVLCSLVGSHSYGFPSRDSDFDLKAIHLAPTAALLGLDAPRATVEYLGMFEGTDGVSREIDFTSHEAKDALSRLLKGDGNVLERILSPYLIAPAAIDQRVADLRRLARGCINRRFHRHYAGFLRGMVRAYDKETSKKIKPLLYMFRVALTGVHLLLEGELIGDLALLLQRYPHDRVTDLFALKAEAELATVDDDRPYLALVPDLQRRLDEALARSPLPEEAPNRAEVDAWLTTARQG